MKNIIATMVLPILCLTIGQAQSLVRFEKFGLKDSTGKIIIDAKYDYISDEFREGLAIVRNGEKWGAINSKGEEIIPVIYDNINNSAGKVLIAQSGIEWDKRKYGLFDNTGKQLLDTIYNGFEFNKYGIAVISTKDSKRGLINKAGKIIMPVKYDNIEFYTEYSSIGTVKESEDKYFYIDTTGKQISQVYEEAGMFSNGKAQVKINNKWGCINEKIKIVAPLKYDESLYFNYGLAKVKLNNKYGVISETGKEIIPVKYDFIVINYSYKIIDVATYDKQAVLSHGLLSFSGKQIIPIKYYSITMIDSTLIAVTNLRISLDEETGEPWNTYTLGFLDRNGKEIIPIKYDDTWGTISNIKNTSKALIVSLNGKSGIIDYTGKELVPFKYDYFKVPEYNKFNLYGIAVYQNKKLGVMNRNAELITPIQYDEINYDFDGHGICKYALVKQNNKWGCVNNVTGKELIEPKYDKIQFIGSGNDPNFDTTDIASVKFCLVRVGVKTDTLYSYEEYEKLIKDGNWEIINDEYLNDTLRRLVVSGGGKWGLVDFNGNEITPIKYDNTRLYFYEGMLPVKCNGKWGYINEEGKEVIPTIYDAPNDYDGIYYFNEQGTTIVRQGDREFSIDKTGKEIK